MAASNDNGQAVADFTVTVINSILENQALNPNVIDEVNSLVARFNPAITGGSLTNKLTRAANQMDSNFQEAMSSGSSDALRTVWVFLVAYHHTSLPPSETDDEGRNYFIITRRDGTTLNFYPTNADCPPWNEH